MKKKDGRKKKDGEKNQQKLSDELNSIGSVLLRSIRKVKDLYDEYLTEFDVGELELISMFREIKSIIDGVIDEYDEKHFDWADDVEKMDKLKEAEMKQINETRGSENEKVIDAPMEEEKIDEKRISDKNNAKRKTDEDVMKPAIEKEKIAEKLHETVETIILDEEADANKSKDENDRMLETIEAELKAIDDEIKEKETSFVKKVIFKDETVSLDCKSNENQLELNEATTICNDEIAETLDGAKTTDAIEISDEARRLKHATVREIKDKAMVKRILKQITPLEDDESNKIDENTEIKKNEIETTKNMSYAETVKSTETSLCSATSKELQLETRGEAMKRIMRQIEALEVIEANKPKNIWKNETIAREEKTLQQKMSLDEDEEMNLVKNRLEMLEIELMNDSKTVKPNRLKC